MQRLHKTSSFSKSMEFSKKKPFPETPSVKPLKMLKEPSLLKLPSICFEDKEDILEPIMEEVILENKNNVDQDLSSKQNVFDRYIRKMNFCLKIKRKNKSKRKRFLSDSSSFKKATKNSFYNFLKSNKKKMQKQKDFKHKNFN